jgi:hypothetical protein
MPSTFHENNEKLSAKKKLAPLKLTSTQTPLNESELPQDLLLKKNQNLEHSSF